MTGSNRPRAAGPWLVLALGLSLAGCASDRDVVLAPEGEADGFATAGDPSAGFFARLFAVLELDTDDPDQWYAKRDADPWFQFSTVTSAESFTLRVTNASKRPAHQVRLLVAVPGDLPEFGWAVTIGSPAVVLSTLEDFPLERLIEAHYPWLPHQVYQHQGNARFMVLEGPRNLAAGETWEVPVQLFRGATANFMVHFDATARRAFAGPHADVTAQPPLSEDGGERAAPGFEL